MHATRMTGGREDEKQTTKDDIFAPQVFCGILIYPALSIVM